MPHNPKSLVIGLDFDGTCVTHEFPKIGQDIGAVPVLKEIVEAGHKLVLWTMRSDCQGNTGHSGEPPKILNGDFLSQAVSWFAYHEIPLWGIQRNPTQDSWTTSPKAYCSIYIDDAALGAPLIFPNEGKPYIDWRAVRAFFFPERVLKRCATTLTERLPKKCLCPTYEGNLGVCRTWEEGGNGRCAYCDHERHCHELTA